MRRKQLKYLRTKVIDEITTQRIRQYEELTGTSISLPVPIEKIVEQVLGLEPGAMTRAREVLREFGNMSAPSVLFVLERVLADRPRGRLLVSSLGPGFTAGFTVLETP